MSWILLVTITFLLAAILLIELRAVHAGDERQHHAPGYVLVLGGLVAIASGIAMALTDEALFALLFSTLGFIAVGLGTIRGYEPAGPHERGHRH